MTTPSSVVAGPLAWMVRGACRGHDDPNLWYPDSPRPAAAQHAVNICRTCPVWRECRAYALATLEPDGVWGGLTPDERRVIRQQMEVKRCRVCQRDLPVPQFNRHPTTRDQLDPRCRACTAEYRRQHTARRRADAEL